MAKTATKKPTIIGSPSDSGVVKIKYGNKTYSILKTPTRRFGRIARTIEQKNEGIDAKDIPDDDQIDLIDAFFDYHLPPELKTALDETQATYQTIAEILAAWQENVLEEEDVTPGE